MTSAHKENHAQFPASTCTPKLTRAILVIHAKCPTQLILCRLAGAHVRCQDKLLSHSATVPIVKRKFGLTLKLTEPVLSLSNSRKIWSRNLSEVKWQIKLISSRKFENMAVQSDVVILMSIPCLSLKT